MKLSIIIPVYNTASYLERCVESVYKNNTLDKSDFEVICVNDGSTDNSAQILNALKQLHSNLMVITQANAGLSAARNSALNVATGTYVYFLDSDDFINASNLVATLSDCNRNNFDVAIVEYACVDESGNFINRQDKDVYSQLDEVISGAKLLSDYTVRAAVWGYLFKRDILEVSQLRFTRGIYHEDEEFTTILLSKCRNVYHSKRQVYFYTHRSGSIIRSTSSIKERKRLESLFYVALSINRLSEKSADSPEVSIGLSKKVAQLSLSFALKLRSSRLPRNEKRVLADRYLSSEIYPIRTNSLNNNQRLAAMLLNFKPFLWYYITC